MAEYLLEQGDYLLRILVAGICGLLIGYERESRMKMAGIRTHTIIAMAAALMVVISKYGFFDVVALDGVSVDASRIAASVVTGVGFLGAGIILNRKTTISGVTTSAGIWATIGIGMALGAGMWILGIGSTAMLLVIQYAFHHNWSFFAASEPMKIRLRLQKGDNARERITADLTKMNVLVLTTRLSIDPNGTMEATMTVLFPKGFGTDKIFTLMDNYPEITSIDS